jgi:hypothetical protein
MLYWISVDLLCDSTPLGKNCVDQLALRRSLVLARGLQVFVRHIQIAVAQIIPDGELVLSHVREHGSDRMGERLPAYAADSHLHKSGLDLAVEDGRGVRVFSLRFSISSNALLALPDS